MRPSRGCGGATSTQEILDSSRLAKRTTWMMAIGVSIIEFSFKFFQFQARIGLLIPRQTFSSPLYPSYIHTRETCYEGQNVISISILSG